MFRRWTFSWVGQLLLQQPVGTIILGIFGIYTRQAICWCQKNTRNYENIVKVSKKIKIFLSDLVKFLFSSQLKSFKMGMEQKSWVVLESTHFRLSAGAKRTQEIIKILPQCPKKSKFFCPIWSNFCFQAN